MTDLTKKNTKSIITHPEGQRLFPGNITGIPGGYTNPFGDYVTPLTGEGMVPGSQVMVLNPYGGVNMVDSSTKQKNIPGNYQLEIPMAQVGGSASQDQQIQQIIMAYAQLSNQQPDQIIKKLKSLSPKQQQEALTSMVKTVQQAMSQQQNAEQQSMMGQQQEMGMAEMGGCIDCQEQFPQAQNLEWFYKKAKGGEAFPQANVYPHMYQTAGTVYTPQDRASDSTLYSDYFIPSNMRKVLQKETFGSHDDIGSAEDFGGDFSVEEMQKFYNDPRRVGFAKAREAAVDAFRKKGKAGKLYLTNDEIRDAAIKFKDIDPTGKLVTHSSMYGDQTYDLKNTLSGPDYWRLMQEIKRNAGKKAEGGEAFPQAQTYLPYDRPGETRPNFMFEKGGEPDQYGGQSNIDDIYRIMKKGGIDYNPKKKKGGKFNHVEEFQKYLQKGGGLKKYQADNSIVEEDNLLDDQYANDGFDWNKYGRGWYSKKGQRDFTAGTGKGWGAPETPLAQHATPLTQSANPINKQMIDFYGAQGKPGGFMHGISAVLGLKDALNTVKSGYKSAKDPKTWYESFGPDGVGVVLRDGGDLPMHQWGTQGTGMQGQGQPLNSFKPVAGAWNNYNANNAQQTMHNTITDVQSAPMHLKENQSYMNDTSKIPNTGITGDQAGTTDNQENSNDKTSQPRISGIPKATRAIAGLSNFANFLESVDQNKQQKKLDEKLNTSEFMPVMTAQIGGMLDYGDYSTNVTQGPNFRPNSYVYAQKESNPYQEVPLYYQQKGGSSILDKYNHDEEYDLPLEEILKILAAGGSVEYLD